MGLNLKIVPYVEAEASTAYQVFDFDDGFYATADNIYFGSVDTSKNAAVAYGKKMTFKLYLDNSTGYNDEPVIQFYANSGNDLIDLHLDGSLFTVYAKFGGTGGWRSKSYFIGDNFGKVINCEINKSKNGLYGQIDSFYIDDIEQTSIGTPNGWSGASSGWWFGRDADNALDNATVFEIKIYDTSSAGELIHHWKGYPNAAADAAWADEVDGIPGEVFNGPGNNRTVVEYTDASASGTPNKLLIVPDASSILILGNTAPLPPGAPLLYRPLDTSTLGTLDPSLAWNSVTDTSTYWVQADDDSGFGSLLYDVSGLTDLYYDVSDLSYSTTYYWRAAATNPIGTGSWSEEWEFDTPAAPSPPGAPTLYRPLDTSILGTVDPSLAWLSVADTSSYWVQLDDDPGFGSLTYDVSGLSNLYYDVSDLSNSTTYYWRAAATNPVGTGSWSTEWEFTTPAAPGPSFGTFTVIKNEPEFALLANDSSVNYTGDYGPDDLTYGGSANPQDGLMIHEDKMYSFISDTTYASPLGILTIDTSTDGVRYGEFLASGEKTITGGYWHWFGNCFDLRLTPAGTMHTTGTFGQVGHEFWRYDISTNTGTIVDESTSKSGYPITPPQQANGMGFRYVMHDDDNNTSYVVTDYEDGPDTYGLYKYDYDTDTGLRFDLNGFTYSEGGSASQIAGIAMPTTTSLFAVTTTEISQADGGRIFMSPASVDPSIWMFRIDNSTGYFMGLTGLDDGGSGEAYASGSLIPDFTSSDKFRCDDDYFFFKSSNDIYKYEISTNKFVEKISLTEWVDDTSTAHSFNSVSIGSVFDFWYDVTNHVMILLDVNEDFFLFDMNDSSIYGIDSGTITNSVLLDDTAYTRLDGNGDVRKVVAGGTSSTTDKNIWEINY